jgi:hypothetical protein
LLTSGRNGNSGVARAMLTMLPKFALVVMQMYLRVLAKVRLPSSTPRCRAWFYRTLSGALNPVEVGHH